MNQNIPIPPQISEEFKDLVIDALENIYDIPHLQSHSLNSYLNEKNQPNDPTSLGNPLRKKILGYLETLTPTQSTNFNSPQHRLYNVMYLRYVEGLTVQQTANELGISSRQAYRDLQKGKDDIAQLFWDDIQKSNQSKSQPENPPTTKTALNPDMVNINISIQQIELSDFIEQSLHRVKPLIQRGNIQVNYTPPTTPIKINTDAAIAQQIFTSIISKSLQKIENEQLNINIAIASPHNILGISFNNPIDDQLVLDETTKTLVTKLGWSIHESTNQNQKTIELKILSQRGIILVIDDNEGIIDLFKRYLSEYDFKVVGCTDSTDAINKARTLKPTLIFLDVMMPYVDGWEVLQNLQIDKETQQMPVVICSVFYDPGLAFSLGAAGVISKPVRKDDITAIFHDLGIA